MQASICGFRWLADGHLPYLDICERPRLEDLQVAIARVHWGCNPRYLTLSVLRNPEILQVSRESCPQTERLQGAVNKH